MLYAYRRKMVGWLVFNGTTFSINRLYLAVSVQESNPIPYQL